MINFTRPANGYNALVLAFIGDAVYHVYVRSRIIEEHSSMTAHKMHVMSAQFVSAHGQSEALARIEDKLTEQELAAYKRGRNTKSYTVPKNADVGEYRRATGFEALLGWLYISGETERLDEIMELSYNSMLDDK